MSRLFLTYMFSLTIFFAQLIGADIDNDLIDDKIDKCLNTPDGVCVNASGCTQAIKKTIYFNQGSYKLTNEAINKIREISELSTECFGYKIYLEGHTDSIWEAKSNLLLSKNRVITIKKLLNLYNIDNKKLNISWYGETKPIASNITKEGRAKNRRVLITLK